MKVLAIDPAGNCVDLLWRAQRAGHKVCLYNKKRLDGSIRKSGQGLVPTIHDFDELRRKWLGWADLIFLPDNVLYLPTLEPYREMGYPIFGCPEAAAELELDRDAGQKLLRKAKIPTLDYRIFHDYDEAIRFVKRDGRTFVSKPSGDANKALSYVPDDTEDLVYMLERWRDDSKLKDLVKEHGFILQEKVSGCEMAVGGWFGPNGWSQWWCENFEYKKLMDGDLGVATGEQGTLARIVKKSKLAEKMLIPLTKQLEELHYVGHFDMNCIIDCDSGEPWGLEPTARPGWPIQHNQVALTEGDVVQWMRDLLDGRDTAEFSSDVCVSVVITIPDFPYSHFTQKQVEGIPLKRIPDGDRFHPSDVMMGDRPACVGGKWIRVPCLVSCGDYIGIVTGRGDTINGARRQAYSGVKTFKMPNNPQWRWDIGAGKLRKTLPQIQKHGYAKGLSFD